MTNDHLDLARRRHIPLTFPWSNGRQTLWLTREEIQVRYRRRELYGHTEPRPGLDLFDAQAMDILEGRA
jgi:hypothetical protein